MPNELERLRDQIRNAFPADAFYGRVTACPCEECKGIIQALQRRSWEEIPPEFIDLTCSPTLLEAEAFRSFLPAYLMRALGDLVGDNVVLEFTVYSLCPAGSEDGDTPATTSHGMPSGDRLLIERARLMSQAQVAAIRGFLSFVNEHSAKGPWLRPCIGASLETVWR